MHQDQHQEEQNRTSSCTSETRRQLCTKSSSLGVYRSQGYAKCPRSKPPAVVTDCDKFERPEIIQNMFSDHNIIEVKITKRKIFKESVTTRK